MALYYSYKAKSMAMGFVTYCVGKLAYIEVLYRKTLDNMFWFLIIILDNFILIINSNED
jgi:ascorbate-specific PTS system EIIC-type component UlaA